MEEDPREATLKPNSDNDRRRNSHNVKQLFLMISANIAAQISRFEIQQLATVQLIKILSLPHDFESQNQRQIYIEEQLSDFSVKVSNLASFKAAS